MIQITWLVVSIGRANCGGDFMGAGGYMAGKRMTKIIDSFSEMLSQRGSLMDRATRALLAPDADRSGAEWIL